MRDLLIVSSLLTAAFFAGIAQAGTQLVMVQQHGCVWCDRWDAEIGPIYSKTAEGEAAPLRRIDLHEERPADLVFKRGVAFTPTFVLVQDGTEVGRIEGYPSEDFFWALLAELIASVPES